jgi:hypothetical protein
MNIDLRTPSYQYNHGGYYGPADPRDCNMPNGPCGVCSDAIEAAKALVAMSQTCPMCKKQGVYKAHEDQGHPKCVSCQPIVCSDCLYGCRYFCPITKARLAQAVSAKKD